MSFKKYPLSNDIQRCLERFGWKTPTPLQMCLLPLLFKDERDIAVIAPQHSGRFGAVSLFAASLLEEEPESGLVRVLIAARTEEVAALARRLARLVRGRAEVGENESRVAYEYTDGKFLAARIDDIVVADPESLEGLCTERRLTLKHLKLAVFYDVANERMASSLRKLVPFFRKAPEVRTILMMPPYASYDSILYNFTRPDVSVQMFDDAFSPLYPPTRFYDASSAEPHAVAAGLVRPGRKTLIATATEAEANDLETVLRSGGRRVLRVEPVMGGYERTLMRQNEPDGPEIMVASDAALDYADLTGQDAVIGIGIPEKPLSLLRRAMRCDCFGESPLFETIVRLEDVERHKVLVKRLGNGASLAPLPNGSETVAETPRLNLYELAQEPLTDFEMKKLVKAAASLTGPEPKLVRLRLGSDACAVRLVRWRNNMLHTPVPVEVQAELTMTRGIFAVSSTPASASASEPDSEPAPAAKPAALRGRRKRAAVAPLVEEAVTASPIACAQDTADEPEVLEVEAAEACEEVLPEEGCEDVFDAEHFEEGEEADEADEADEAGEGDDDESDENAESEDADATDDMEEAPLEGDDFDDAFFGGDIGEENDAANRALDELDALAEDDDDDEGEADEDEPHESFDEPRRTLTIRTGYVAREKRPETAVLITEPLSSSSAQLRAAERRSSGSMERMTHHLAAMEKKGRRRSGRGADVHLPSDAVFGSSVMRRADRAGRMQRPQQPGLKKIHFSTLSAEQLAKDVERRREKVSRLAADLEALRAEVPEGDAAVKRSESALEKARKALAQTENWAERAERAAARARVRFASQVPVEQRARYGITEEVLAAHEAFLENPPEPKPQPQPKAVSEKKANGRKSGRKHRKGAAKTEGEGAPRAPKSSKAAKGAKAPAAGEVPLEESDDFGNSIHYKPRVSEAGVRYEGLSIPGAIPSPLTTAYGVYTPSYGALSLPQTMPGETSFFGQGAPRREGARKSRAENAAEGRKQNPNRKGRARKKGKNPQQAQGQKPKAAPAAVDAAAKPEAAPAAEGASEARPERRTSRNFFRRKNRRKGPRAKSGQGGQGGASSAE